MWPQISLYNCFLNFPGTDAQIHYNLYKGEDELNWDMANEECQRYGGQLAVLDTEDKLEKARQDMWVNCSVPKLIKYNTLNV